ncbi:hypothetical protein LGN44_29270, partial [Burkholderia cepacia]|uniref:hypothetical protein n=1 Tax=Burkholderia cepacia TaxID=292 RepID=UPI001CF5942A
SPSANVDVHGLLQTPAWALINGGDMRRHRKFMPKFRNSYEIQSTIVVDDVDLAPRIECPQGCVGECHLLRPYDAADIEKRTATQR